MSKQSPAIAPTSMSQLPRLHRTLALRDLRFPLDRIGKALEEGVSADSLRGMLLLRQLEQEKQVDEETSGSIA